jgi:segregation and condensation protein B
MTPEKIQAIIEAALMVAGHPLTILSLQNLFSEEERPTSAEIKSSLGILKERYQPEQCGIELHEVASGYRIQAKSSLSPWLSKLWEERAPRYSRAFLETLVIIAYKQPLTRGEIEEIRGVTVSSNIMKTLQEREWVRVIGYREVPGKPAIYGTTKTFLDYFNLKSLTDLPSLAEFKDLAAQEKQLQVQLALENSQVGPNDSEQIPQENNVIDINEAYEGSDENDEEALATA